jgi:hypothetical protein
VGGLREESILLMAKLETTALRSLFLTAQELAPVGTLWQHYKGGTYIVTGHGFDTERQDLNVQYRRVAGPDFRSIDESQISYHRPLNEWNGVVEGEAIRHRFARMY